MKALLQVETPRTIRKEWKFPINTHKYDCSPYLIKSEKEEIQTVLDRKTTWFTKSYEVLERLLCPLNDALDITESTIATRRGVRKVIICEMNNRQTSFWAWAEEDWNEILCSTHKDFQKSYKVSCDCRPKLTLIIYLLFGINTYRIHQKFSSSLFSNRLFGKELVDKAISIVYETYLQLGYAEARVKDRFSSVICEVLIANRSPYLEDLTIEFLDALRKNDHYPEYIKSDLVWLSNVLANLGIITQSLRRRKVEDYSTPIATTNVALEWQSWCQRWHDTSTLAPKTRRMTYYNILKVGRWLFQEHPGIVAPEQWNRGLAIKFVAAVDRMLIGQYVVSKKSLAKKINKPVSPRHKSSLIYSLRRFFKDCQEWEWTRRNFSPERALATPRSIRGLISPDPRVIADDVWAKLLWAGLNLTKEDLPQPTTVTKNFWYPLEMVRAIAMIWLFAGLRSDEIYRLRVGCVRWQRSDVIIPGTHQVVPKDAVCYLDVPVNKTGTAYTKPVDRSVGEAIEAWERVRLKQPTAVDRKTSSIVHYLFSCRGQRVGSTYLNKSIIPMLCNKAGVPREDVRGNITSHRARSTTASQLCDTMSLLDLQQWLGHHDVSSTINYTKVSPTKLAAAYNDANYFNRNLRTIEVLIDQDAIKSGAAAAGEPYMYYDLGHGYCKNDFFIECQHRMACAKCVFYEPKGSSKAQMLEANASNQRMLQEIPLTNDELKAVEGDSAALDKLLGKLADVPTPVGPTPRQLKATD